MTHRYGHPILVTCAGERPARFTWQGTEREVVDVLATWRLRDHWWDAATHSDRAYYRLRCADGLLCEVYWDVVAGKWVLDRVWD
jgi:hypothetical protein